MPCFTERVSANSSIAGPVDKEMQAGIRNVRLTMTRIVRQYNARRKNRSTPKLVFRPIFGEDQLSGHETRIPVDNRLLVIPVPDIPKDKTLAPFASKPEHARFALSMPAPGVQFGAKICGRRNRDRVGTFARQMVQWAAHLASAGTMSQLPWKLGAPLHLSRYYISGAEFAGRKKTDADASGTQNGTQQGCRLRLMKADHFVD